VELTDRQKRYAMAMDMIVAQFGVFDQSSQGDGAHYVDGQGNPFKEEGLVCGNCVAFQGNRACRWVSGDIDGLGICRLWVIPEDAIMESGAEDEEEEDEEEMESGEEDEEEEDEEEEYGMTKAGTFRPPQGVQAEARRALEWIKEGHAGSGFTDVGRKRASDLARGAEVSLDTVKRMRSFLSRHAVDSQGKGWSPGSDGYPSPGRVAYSAWGGKAGLSWTNKILRSQDDE
jgi:hypothetical protein